jgi:hypothetical protein
VTKWVQVDLGRSVALDEIRLVPARPTDFPDTPGFGFPLRFKVEIAEDAQFTNAQVIADHTGTDYKNPGDAPIILSLALSEEEERAGVRGPSNSARLVRFIRITATRLWARTADYVFALGELQAFAAGTNAARGAHVTALDSIEVGRWGKKKLVDGFSSRAPLSDAALTSEQIAHRRALEAEVRRLTTERQRLFGSLVPAKRRLRLRAWKRVSPKSAKRSRLARTRAGLCGCQ